MKTKFLLLVTFITIYSINVCSQAPNSFKFQSVVRNIEGIPLTNQLIGIKISILEGGTFGSVVYSEAHSTTSNTLGIINLNIGDGSQQTGSISTVDWSSGTYFIKIEMDESGGSNYTLSTTSQLLSVPFALYANSVNSIDWNSVHNKPIYLSGETIDMNTKLSNLASKSYVDSIAEALKTSPIPTVDFGYGVDFSTSDAVNYLTCTNASQAVPQNSIYSWYLDASLRSTTEILEPTFFSKANGNHTIGLTIVTPDNISYSKSKVFQIKNNTVISDDYPVDTSANSRPIVDFSYSIIYSADSTEIRIGFADACNNIGSTNYISMWNINDSYVSNLLTGHQTFYLSGHYSITYRIEVDGVSYSKYKEFEITGLK